MRTQNLRYTINPLKKKIFTKNAPTLAFENVLHVHDGVIHGLYELCIFLIQHIDGNFDQKYDSR